MVFIDSDRVGVRAWVDKVRYPPINIISGLDQREKLLQDLIKERNYNVRLGTDALILQDDEKRKAEILSIQTRRGKPTF